MASAWWGLFFFILGGVVALVMKRATDTVSTPSGDRKKRRYGKKRVRRAIKAPLVVGAIEIMAWPVHLFWDTQPAWGAIPGALAASAGIYGVVRRRGTSFVYGPKRWRVITWPFLVTTAIWSFNLWIWWLDLGLLVLALVITGFGLASGQHERKIATRSVLGLTALAVIVAIGGGIFWGGARHQSGVDDHRVAVAEGQAEVLEAGKPEIPVNWGGVQQSVLDCMQSASHVTVDVASSDTYLNMWLAQHPGTVQGALVQFVTGIVTSDSEKARLAGIARSSSAGRGVPADAPVFFFDVNKTTACGKAPAPKAGTTALVLLSANPAGTQLQLSAKNVIFRGDSEGTLANQGGYAIEADPPWTK